MKTAPHRPDRSHIWSMENIVRDQAGMPVEYDLRCRICGKVQHVEQPPFDLCPGTPDDEPEPAR